MHLSEFAGELRCQHCGGLHGTREWPAKGDLVPFYFQKGPGNHNLEVRCPHCGMSWYVVWDSYPGPPLPLDGVAAPRVAPQAAARPPAPRKESRRLLIGVVVFTACMLLLFAMTWTDGSGCTGEVGSDLTACRLKWVGIVSVMSVIGYAVFGTIYLIRRRRGHR